MAQKTPKLYIFDLENWEKHCLLHKLEKYKPELIESKLTVRNANRYKDAEMISIFVYSKIDAAILEKLPKLKFITTRSTGFDHIDIVECKKRGIKVANVPFYGENTVAEHTFALILTLSRRIYEAYEKVRDFEFDFHGLRGWDLKGKTIGIIGCGHIGRHVARMAQGFEMKVLVFDTQKDARLAKSMHFTYARNLDELLKKSDVITLHAPYNSHTHHLINKENIGKIKKGAILVNTARGGLIDTQALLWALDKKILSGAGLDVLEEEYVISEESEYLSGKIPKECNLMTILADHALIARKNVIVTPHIAFNSSEAIDRICKTTIENIKAYLTGKKKNLIA